jgi:hypothetical protein
MFRILIISLLVLGLGGCSKEKPKDTATTPTSESTTTQAPATAPEEKPEEEVPPPPPPGDGEPKKEQDEETEESAPPPAPPKAKVAENTSLVDEAKNATITIPTTPVLSPKAATRVVSAPPPVVAKAPPAKAAVPAPAKTAVPVAKVQPIPVQPAPQPQPKTAATAPVATVDDFSHQKLEELNGLAKPLVEEIATKVEANPTGTGTINAASYQRKNVTIDGIPYQIDVSKNFFQVRQGDPKTSEETFYFLDIDNDGKLDRVLQLNEKMEGADADAEIMAMQMNLYLPFSSVYKEVELRKSMGQTNFPDYNIYWLGDPNMAASILFESQAMTAAKTDNNAHLVNKRRWAQVLSLISKELPNAPAVQPTTPPTTTAAPAAAPSAATVLAPILTDDECDFVQQEVNQQVAGKLGITFKKSAKVPDTLPNVGELLVNQTSQNQIPMIRFEMEVSYSEPYKVPSKDTYERLVSGQRDKSRAEIVRTVTDNAERGKRVGAMHDELDEVLKKILEYRRTLTAADLVLKKNESYDYVVSKKDQFGKDIFGTPFIGKVVYYLISQSRPGDEFELKIPKHIGYHDEDFALKTEEFHDVFDETWHSPEDEKWKEAKLYLDMRKQSSRLNDAQTKLRDLLMKEIPTAFAPPFVTDPKNVVQLPKHPAPWVVIKIKVLPVPEQASANPVAQVTTK